jgi:hypothetical protein
MGKPQSQSGLINVISYDTNGNISFVSGSTTLMSVSSSKDITTTGKITATTLVVQTITSSVDFVTGSTRFGSIAANTHTFTGSIYMNPGGLFVSSSGLTGIGTTNPTATLHVGGNLLISSPNTSVSLIMPDTYGNPSIQLVADNPGVGNMIVNNWGNSQNPGLVVGTTRNDGFAFQVANSISLTNGLPANTGSVSFVVLGNGNVGIGLTSPASSLDVLQELRVSYANANQYRIRIYNSDGNGRLFVDGNETALMFGTSPTGTGATATEKMRITSGGNVGIGVTNPGSFRLWVSGSQLIDGTLQMDAGGLNQSKAIAFNANNSAGGTYGDINWYNVQWDGNLRGSINVESDGALANGRMIFKTGASGGNAIERMRIASTGNITCTNNSVKRATLTKFATIGSSSSGNISFNVVNELGTPGAGYIMVEISAICYGGAGSNGMVYKAIAGGYSGHTINSSYHRYSEYVKIITNGSVDIYNPSYDVYGISVTNGAGSGINIILRLDVTWYG